MAAKRLGIGRIYVPPLSQFTVAEGKRLGTIEFTPFNKREEIAEPALFGTFFDHQLLGDLTSAGPTGNKVITDRFVAPLFVPSVAVEKRPKNHVAMHIRSGDLFGPDPHPEYPQPPLAYYDLILDHIMRKHPEPHVTLVFEDRLNPIVDALEGLLRQRAIACSTQSGTLEEDLRCILSHRIMVFGRGTFGKAVVALAPFVKRVYFPWNDPDFGSIESPDGIRRITVADSADTYIRVGDWANTPGQRDLMLRYPKANLSVSQERETDHRQEDESTGLK